jgi:hypothetical protein
VGGFEGRGHRHVRRREAEGWERRPPHLGAERHRVAATAPQELVGELVLREHQLRDERGEAATAHEQLVVDRRAREPEHTEPVDAVADREPRPHGIVTGPGWL